jgi:hypothetical protein
VKARILLCKKVASAEGVRKAHVHQHNSLYVDEHAVAGQPAVIHAFGTMSDDSVDLARKVLGALEGIREAAAAAEGQIKREGRRKLFRDCLIAFLMFAIAVIAGSGAWIGYEKLREVRDWATYAEKRLAAALSYQRAWVGPTSARVVEPLEIGKPATLLVEYANTGHEPAVNMTYGIDVLSVAPPNDAKLDEFFKRCNETAPAAGQVVFPSTGLSVQRMSAALKPELVDRQLVEGEKTLVVAGCFLYRTAASDAIRRTFFCYLLNTKQSKNGIMSICNAGNAAN